MSVSGTPATDLTTSGPFWRLDGDSGMTSNENGTASEGLLQAAPFGLAVIESVRGVILETNRAADRLLGLAPGTEVSFSDVVAGDGEELLRALERIDCYESAHFTFRSRAPADADYLIHAWAYRVESRERSLIYCTFMRPGSEPNGGGEDATRSVWPDNLLQEVARLRREEEQSRVRTAELEAATLRLSLADRRKDEFLAQLAHEMRNPLAPIRIWTQRLLKSSESPPLVRHASEVVDRQVRHLTRLVEDLLEVSQFISGKMTLRQEMVCLHDALELAVQMARPLVEERQQSLLVSAGPSGLWVKGDLGRLAEVFHNLLDNAAKYSPPAGQIRLTVSEQSGEAVVKVDDQGIGIEPEFMPRVFDLFSRGPQAQRLSHGGLGLGLSLVQQVVQAHAGSVSARSGGVGQGSLFEVRLPLTTAPCQAPAAAEPGPVTGLRRHQILVVDDERDVAEALALYLEDQGHEVKVALDGGSALGLAEAFRPQFILLDIGMPGMDGHELARRLRARPWAGKTVLLAISGYHSEDDRQRSLAAGCDEHLVKPIDPEAMTALLAGYQRELD